MSIVIGPTEIPTDGLSLLLDAGNKRSYSGFGYTWYDLSGKGKHARSIDQYQNKTVPNYTSAGNLSYFNVNGSSFMSDASNSFGITNTSGYTIFLMAIQNSYTNASAFKFYGDAAYTRGIFSHCTWGDNNIYFDQGGCCNSDTRTYVASGGSLSWNIYTFRRETGGSTRTIWKNGTLLMTNTNTAANINLNGTALEIGSSDEYGPTWDAKINAFIVYNRGITDSEIAKVVATYRGRYGV